MKILNFLSFSYVHKYIHNIFVFLFILPFLVDTCYSQISCTQTSYELCLARLA